MNHTLTLLQVFRNQCSADPDHELGSIHLVIKSFTLLIATIYSTQPFKTQVLKINLSVTLKNGDKISGHPKVWETMSDLP